MTFSMKGRILSMENNLAVIGGDLRIVKLVEMLANEGKTVYVTGLEKAENLKNIDNVIFCETISKTLENSKIVIGPVPFTTNAKDVNTPFSDNQITIQELLSKEVFQLIYKHILVNMELLIYK